MHECLDTIVLQCLLLTHESTLSFCTTILLMTVNERKHDHNTLILQLPKCQSGSADDQFSKCLFILRKTRCSRFLLIRFLFPEQRSPHTENTRSTQASEAGADMRSCATGARSGYTCSLSVQNCSGLLAPLSYLLSRLFVSTIYRSISASIPGDDELRLDPYLLLMS